MKSIMKPKKITIEQYQDRYCKDQRIRNRKTIYISKEMHKAISDVAFLFRDSHVSVTSLVDTILREHIDGYKALFDAEQNKQNQEFLDWLNSDNK